MSAVHDVLLELPECGQLEVRIGHRQLFELALQYVGESGRISSQTQHSTPLQMLLLLPPTSI